MLFYTPEFLTFFVALLALLAVIHRDEPRKLVLLVASYVFYMWWNPAFILLIVASTVIDYLVGGAMADATSPRRRRALLVLSMTSNLGLLGFFKYAGFLTNSLLGVSRLFGAEPGWVTLHITLPVGISFYTFQTMSYTIDVYRGQLERTRSPLDFALFVAFFPQLVAGPIVRAADFLPQLRHPVTVRLSAPALFLIVRGLAKKVLVADNIAVLSDRVFAAPDAWPSLVVWIATICFATQIYCDFSGYSDIAIGLGRILGFRLPLNFDHPYVARNPSDFWRRWHISLSQWLRDYLYISLGGNRGTRLRTYRNLMITMLLGGLWHGASWNFVLWGFLHGLLLVVHRLWSEWRAGRTGAAGSPARAPGLLVTLLSVAAMQYCVLVTWITFRVTDVGDMAVAVRKFVLFDFDLSVANLGLGSMAIFSTGAIVGAFFVLHALSYRVGRADEALARAPDWIGAAVCFAAGLAAVLAWPLTDAPFIYFQF